MYDYTESSTVQSPLLSLPDEIIIAHILEEIDLISLSSCAQTCRRLYRLAEAALFIYRKEVAHYGRVYIRPPPWTQQRESTSDCPGNEQSIVSLLNRQREREDNWHRLAPEADVKMAYPTPPRALLCLGDGFGAMCSNLRSMSWSISTFALPSISLSTPIQLATITQPLSNTMLMDMAMDPLRDLLVTLQFQYGEPAVAETDIETPDRTFIATYSLSTGHPNEAHGQEKDVNITDAFRRANLQVAGDFVVLQSEVATHFLNTTGGIDRWTNTIFIYNLQSLQLTTIEWISAPAEVFSALQSEPFGCLDKFHFTLITSNTFVVCSRHSEHTPTILSLRVYGLDPMTHQWIHRRSYLLPPLGRAEGQHWIFDWKMWGYPFHAPPTSVDASRYAPGVRERLNPSDGILTIRFRTPGGCTIAVFSKSVFLDWTMTDIPLPSSPSSTSPYPHLFAPSPIQEIPWHIWGPQNSRFFNLDRRTATYRSPTPASFGYKLVTLSGPAVHRTEQSGRIHTAHISLLDFSPATVKWAMSKSGKLAGVMCDSDIPAHHLTENECEHGGGIGTVTTRKLILQPSVLPANVLFAWDVENTLPYYEVVSEETISTAELRIDEDRIFFVDHGASDWLRVQVF